jgi:type II secretory pathway component PulK
MTVITPARHCPQQRGAVLIVTMVVVFALAAMVLAMGRVARVEAISSANDLAAAESQAIAQGAEQFVIALLDDPATLDDLGEEDFAAVPVGRGCFWIVRPDYDADLPQLGLVDESGKLDLNTASTESLQTLPGMTTELAASIVDWRDPDDTPTLSGAETSVYQGKVQPYRAKNAPFECLEELLLVQGMTREYLWGRSTQAGTSLGVDRLEEIGLFHYVTVWNLVPNDAADGSGRVNIAGGGNQRQALINLLIERLGASRGNELASHVVPPAFTDIFQFASRTGITADELRLIEDNLTSQPPNQPLRGRVNINTAPRQVLLTLTGMDEVKVDQLLAARPGAVAAHPGTLAWVWQTLNSGAIGLGNQIIARGGQYSAEIVAVSGNGRSFRRVRIIVDATQDSPRVVYRRDISDQGWPLEDSILADLRAGRRTMSSLRQGVRP